MHIAEKPYLVISNFINKHFVLLFIFRLNT